MKTIFTPALLLAITTGLTASLRAEDAPKQRPNPAAAGQGGEKFKQMMLQKFDANKNGTLDPEEREAAMKAMQERRKGGTPGTTGEPKAGEAGKAILLQKFDANKNGIIDPEEREAAMKAMQDRKGKSGGFNPAPSSTEGGSKFRRPPEVPKEGTTPKENEAAKK
ncbi:MAG: hypothetical protein U1F71_06015 [Verrucomicrobiaceae bacterium]